MLRRGSYCFVQVPARLANAFAAALISLWPQLDLVGGLVRTSYRNEKRASHPPEDGGRGRRYHSLGRRRPHISKLVNCEADKLTLSVSRESQELARPISRAPAGRPSEIR